jgi:hypothetical protein
VKRLLVITMLAVVLAVLATRSAPGGVSAQTPPGLDPASVTATMKVDTSISIAKTVHTPSIPAAAHICFLADTTGSMGASLANVQANILTTIVPAILADSPSAQFCAAQYKDVGSGDPFAYNLDQGLTTNTADLSTAVGTWSASGGGDTPEGQLNALTQLAAHLKANPKTNATRFIVWFGDNPGHDPSNGATLASVEAALASSGIKVIAIPVVSCPFDGVFCLGLDFTGQATAITAATGGVLVPDTAPGDVAAAILAGLTSVPISVGLASNCSYPIITTFSANQTVTSGASPLFKEIITVAPNAKPATYECDDWATIDGVPMTNAAGVVILEHKTITVPNPEIIKRPDLANLWLCQPVASCAVPSNGIGERDFNVYLRDPVTSNSPKGEPQTIGSFEFQVRYDAKFVSVTVDAGPLFDRADASCSRIPGQGFVSFRCNIKGKTGAPAVGPGTLAIVRVRPTADVYSMLIPNQDNGIATQLINQGCQLSDLQGHPIATKLCSDAELTIRYLEGDVNADCVVNVQDQQLIAFRWGSRVGNLLYNSRYDLEPAAPKKGDGDIDAKDLQVVFGRHTSPNSTCTAPHPAQDPVDPKALPATATPTPHPV